MKYTQNVKTRILGTTLALYAALGGCTTNHTQIDYNNAKVQSKMPRFEDGFLQNLEKMCEDLDMDCMGLLSIMDYETAGTFSPRIKNPRGTATGLIQFTSATARDLGTSTKELRSMTQNEQLEYVRKYFEQHQDKADYSNPRDIALSVFYPKAVGKSENFTITRKGKRAYWQNRGLDRHPKDGKITAKEYVQPALRRGYFRGGKKK